jgi:hypothetical protein
MNSDHTLTHESDNLWKHELWSYIYTWILIIHKNMNSDLQLHMKSDHTLTHESEKT